MVRASAPAIALFGGLTLALMAGTAPGAGAGQGSGGGAAPAKAVVADAPELDDASPRDLVTDAQRLLRLRGFDPGPLDGAVGLRTREAIRAYQSAARAQGLLEAMRRPAPGQARPVEPAAGPARVRAGSAAAAASQ